MAIVLQIFGKEIKKLLNDVIINKIKVLLPQV
jgi:hypothetical protein